MVKLSFEHAKLIQDSFYTHQDLSNTLTFLSLHVPVPTFHPDGQSPREQLYFQELLEMLSRENVTIYDTFRDLCGLEKRFCDLRGSKCEDLFSTIDDQEPVLFLITGLRVFFAYHMLEICAGVLDKAFLRYTRLEESTLQTDLQESLIQAKCEHVGELRDVNPALLEPFAIVASRCLALIGGVGLAEKDMESVLAIVFCHPFLSQKNLDWDLAIAFVAELLDKYREQDDPGSKAPSDLLGVKLYQLFKANSFLQPERLRRIGELCIGHYMKLVENWDLDFPKLKESIDRDEFSKSNLEGSEIALRILNTLHDAFRFSPLPTVEYQMASAWETLVKYQWARKRLMELQDPVPSQTVP